MLTIALPQTRIFVVTRNKNYIIYVKMKNLYISLKCHQNILLKTAVPDYLFFYIFPVIFFSVKFGVRLQKTNIAPFFQVNISNRLIHLDCFHVNCVHILRCQIMFLIYNYTYFVITIFNFRNVSKYLCSFLNRYF